MDIRPMTALCAGGILSVLVCGGVIAASPTVCRLYPFTGDPQLGPSQVVAMSTDGTAIIGNPAVGNNQGYVPIWSNNGAPRTELFVNATGCCGRDQTIFGISGNATVLVGHNFDQQSFHWKNGAWVYIQSGSWAGKGVSASFDGKVIVGNSASSNESGGFLWSQAVGLIQVNPFPSLPYGPTTSVNYVSSDGTRIVGSFLARAGGQEPAQDGTYWMDRTNGRVVLLPRDPYSNAKLYVYALSADGNSILSRVTIDANGAVLQAVRWSEASGIEGLGHLPGGVHSVPFACNADASVSGGRGASDGELVAWIWTQSLGMVPLSALLEHLGVDLTGWRLEEVRAISADATVVAGNGFKNGVQSGFVISGMSYPSTPRSLSDFNWDGFVDFTDFDLFIRSFEMGSLSADTNHDGFLDFTDFDAFVSAFEAGV